MSDTACRACGTLNDEARDFCEKCGEYLRWAPTTMVAAVGAGPDEPPPLAPPPPDPAMEQLEDALEAALADDTGETPAVPPPAGAATPPAMPAAPPPADPRPPAGTGVPLAPGVESALGRIAGGATMAIAAATGPDLPAVAPGGAIAFVGTIRNESRIVDNYDIVVAGLPEGWAVAMPATVYLMPAGAGTGAEQEVRIELAPPRAYDAFAGVWSFEVVARSRATGQPVAAVECSVNVLPFEQWSTSSEPRTAKGRRRARYVVEVRNEGNAPQTLHLYAFDDDGRVGSRFAQPSVTLQAGEARRVRMVLRALRPIPVGRPVDHRVTIEASTEAPVADPDAPKGRGLKARLGKVVGGTGLTISQRGVQVQRPRPPAKPRGPQLRVDAATLGTLFQAGDPGGPPGARQVVFRQKALVPVWAIVLLVLLAAAAYAAWRFWPRTTEVPRVVGAASVFEAEKRLRESDLEVRQPVERQKTDDVPAGSVIAQLPAPGEEVRKGTGVRLQIAVGTGQAEVPRLTGLTREAADERLRDSGLALGTAQPADAPETWVVKGQVPKAGLTVGQETLVQVTLRKPPAKKRAGKGKDAGDEEAGGGGGGGGGGGAAAKAIVPPIDGADLKGYKEKLGEAGLRSVETRRIDESPKGSLMQVVPEQGTPRPKGSFVRLIVSAGTPPVAVETTDLVKVIDPLTRKGIGRFPTEDGTGRDPAFTADGRSVLFTSEAGIFLGELGEEAPKPKLKYDGGMALEQPALPAGGDSTSVAFIRRTEEDGDLCLASLASVRMRPQCLPDDGWDLTGPISWRRDGRALLVAARDQEEPSVFGIRQYTSRRPFSQDPESWRGRTATDVSTPGRGVLRAAYSPRDSRIAAIANLETRDFRVVTAKPTDLALVDGRVLDVPACDVGWRRDGGELLAMLADAECRATTGRIVRFAPGREWQQTKVAARGRNARYGE